MKRLSPSMTVALLALFVALAGTGLAASRYLVTSTKQIKPSVLRSLRGREGPQGPMGLQGFSGAPGPPGAKGATGGEANLNRLCFAITLAQIEADSVSSPPAANEAVERALTTIHSSGC